MELKEGTPIAYNTSTNYHSGCFMRFSKVEKVFKNGQILLENGYKFNKYGKMIKSSATKFPSGYLVDIESANETIKKENEIKEVRLIVSDLLDAINSKRASYHNIYWISPECLQDMVSLTEKLK